MSKNEVAPRIVRRKVVSGGGHHGGAWKVAYADFVTAMMAFFLLMWLLGATNEKQRKGIADYFNPTIPINKVSGGGEGAFGGDTVFSENTLTQQGSGGSMLRPTDANAAKGSTGVDQDATSEADKAEAAKMGELSELLNGTGGESMVSDLMQRHIVSRLTDEGLIVEVFDRPDAALFDRNGAPTELMDDILSSVTQVFNLAENGVAIRAHTATRPIVVADNDPWGLTTARADTVREALESKGLDDGRTQRITGAADTQLVTDDPFAVRNNRVEIILLRTVL